MWFMMLWAVVCLCFWVEGRERGVDCVWDTGRVGSAGSKCGDAGAAWLAQALEKNTTRHTLDLNGEFVVLGCVGVGEGG